MHPPDLPAAWRARAAELRRWADAEGAARALEQAAAELEAAQAEQSDELLTLSEAADASGYSERRLRELLAAGELPQAGRRGRPRIRRGDLPRRAKSTGTGYDPAADAAGLIGKLKAV